MTQGEPAFQYTLRRADSNSTLVLGDEADTERLRLHPTERTFHGELNENYLWLDENSNFYIQRIPIKDAAIIPYIEEDLRESKFLSNGGAYKFRSLPEQAAFIVHCLDAGLPVIKPIYVSDTEMISPFVMAESYERYLARGATKLVRMVIANTFVAHQRGIVYSDRWGPNTLVDEQHNRLYEIDFDISLSGPWTREFELAQVVYHTLHYSSQRVAVGNEIVRLLSTSTLRETYNPDMFACFLWGHAEGRRDHVYAGVLADIRTEVSTLLDIIGFQVMV